MIDTIQKALKSINAEYSSQEYKQVWSPQVDKLLIDFTIDILFNELNIGLKDQLRFIKNMGQDQGYRMNNQSSYMQAWIYYKLLDELDIKNPNRKEVRKLIRKFFESSAQQSIRQLIRNVGKVQGLKEQDLEDIYPIIETHSYYLQYTQSLEQSNQPLSVDKQILQAYQNSIQDLKSMPLNSPQAEVEKIIQTAMISKYDFIAKQNNPDCLTMEQLKDNLRTNARMNREIQNLIEEIQKDPTKILDKVRGIKKELCKIDIPELIRLIKKAEKSKERIRGKHIILFIGTTGAGKTTTILKALGYILKVTKKGKLITLVSEQKLKKQHVQLITSPQSKSVTRYIFAAQLPAEYLTVCKEKQIYICDSAGFGDSVGIQVDIANGIVMIKGIHECASVRIVLVISSKNWGDRGQGPKELSKILSQFFIDYDNVEASISFIFNKFSPSQVIELPNKCQDLINNMNQWEKSQKNLSSFLYHLKEVSQSDKKIIMDPFQKNTKNLIKRLIQSKPIKQPCSEFKYSFTEITKKTIKSTTLQLQKQIKNSFDMKKYDFTLYYLRLLKSLCEVLNQLEDNEIMKSCIKIIKEEASAMYNRFEKLLKSKVLLNRADQEILQQMKNCQQKLSSLKKLSEIAQIPGINEIDHMLKTQEKKIIDYLNNKQLTSQFISAFNTFANHFNPQLSKQIEKILTEKFQQTYQMIIKIIQNEDFDNLEEKWIVFAKQSECMINIGRQNYKQNIQNKVNQKLNNIVDNYIEIIEHELLISNGSSKFDQDIKALSQSQISQESVRKGVKILEKLSLIGTTTVPISQTVRNHKKNIQRSLIHNVQQMAFNINSIVESIDSSHSFESHAFNNLKNCQKNIEKLMQIPQVKLVASRQVTYCERKLKRLVQNESLVIEKIIEDLRDKNAQRIKISLIKMNKAILRVKLLVEKRDNQSLQDTTLELQNKVVEEMKIYLQDWNDSIQSNNPRKKNKLSQFIRDSSQQLRKIQQFKKYVNLNQDISKIMDQINTKIQGKIMLPINQMKKKISEIQKEGYKGLRIRIKDLEQYTNYITTIEQNNIEFTHLNSKINKNVGDIKNTLMVLFSSLINDFDKNKSQVMDDKRNRQAIQIFTSILRIIRKIHDDDCLTSYLCCEGICNISVMLEQIQLTIANQVESIEKQFTEVKAKNNINILLNLLANCKCLRQIDRQIPNPNDQIKQLIKEIQIQINLCRDNAKDLLDRIVSPNKMQINQNILQRVYSECKNQGSHSATKTKQNIIQKLKQVQYQLMSTITYHERKVPFEDTLQNCHKEQSQLQQAIKYAYNFRQILDKNLLKQDMPTFIINNQYLEKHSKTIFEEIKCQYQQIIQKLQSYNLQSIPNRIKSLAKRQRLLQMVMGAKLSKDVRRIIEESFWEEGNNNNKQFKEKTKTIASKLNYILHIQRHHKDQIPEIHKGSFNAKLISQYTHLSPNSRQDFENKINEYFSNQLSNYQKQVEQDPIKQAQLLSEIARQIQFLPLNLKKSISNDFKHKQRQVLQKIKANAFLQSRKLTIKEIIQKINHYPKEKQKQLLPNLEDQLEEIIIKCQKNNSSENMLDQLQKNFIYFENINNLSSLDEKIKQLFHRHQENLISEIEQMLRQMITKQRNVLNLDSKVINAHLKHQQYEQQDQLYDKKDNSKENITSIMKIYKYFVTNKGISQRHKNKQIINQIHQFISQGTDIYEKCLNDVQLQQIFSVVTLQAVIRTQSILIKAESISKYYTNMIQQIQNIKVDLHQQMKNCLKKHRQIQTYQSKIKQVAKKVNSIIQHFSQFTIYGQQMRQKNQEEICQFLQSLDKTIIVLEAIEGIFNKIGQNNQIVQINSEKIKQSFRQSREEWLKNMSKEIAQSICPESTNVNTYIKVYRLMKNNRISFINYETDDEEQIQKYLNQKYHQLNKKINTFLNNLSKNPKLNNEQNGKEEQNQSQLYGSQKKEQSENIIDKDDEHMHQLVNCFIGYRKINQIQSLNVKNRISELNQHLEKVKKLDEYFRNKFYELLKSSYYVMIANKLIAEIDLFKGRNLSTKIKRNAKTFEQILTDITNLPKEQSKQLKIYCQKYQKQVEKWLQHYKQDHETDSLVNEIKSKGQQLKQFYKEKKKQGSDVKYNLIAQIMALWIIFKSQLIDGKVEYSFQPYPTQVICILLLLGMTKKSQEQQLRNRVVEMNSGEGKSLVLAVLCSYLALVGFKVYCACFSVYLSKRDEKQFHILFDRLDVSNRIRYGTLEDHCKRILNPNQGVSFETYIKDIVIEQNVSNITDNNFNSTMKRLFNKQNKDQKNKQTEMNILLIDEIDTLFGKNYFSFYQASINLQDETINELFNFIWDSIQKQLDFETKSIQKSQQFMTLIQKYPHLTRILRNQVERIFHDAKDYFIISKLGSTAPQIPFEGYQQIFQKIENFKNNKVKDLTLKQAIKISLKLGQFAYSQLPNLFNQIFAVTCDLQSLPKHQRKQLQLRYNFQGQFMIPSVFKDRMELIKSYSVTKNQKHYKQLVKKINQNLTKKSILVFFRTVQDLMKFYNSLEFKELKKQTALVTQNFDYETQCKRIQEASQSRKLTLLTASFGKGTDFTASDVSQIGMHVIQAFLSVKQLQEIQIKGRIAKNGKNVSYDLIVPIQQCSLFDISENYGISEKSFQDCRKIMEKNRSQSFNFSISHRNKKHSKTVDQYLCEKQSINLALQQIQKLNEFTLINRTILAIDATCSMSSALQKIKCMLQCILDKTSEIINQTKIKSSFELQIILYRNYNSDAKMLLQTSNFSKNPQQLGQFIDYKWATGEWGSEAIQVCLQYINKLPNISQIILIGDKGANSEDQTKEKRKDKGEEYWEMHNYILTNIKEQTQKVIESKIPIHTLFLGAPQYFRQISERTNGNYQQLYIQDANAEKQLEKFVVQHILKMIGREGEGQKMIQQYQNMK